MVCKPALGNLRTADTLPHMQTNAIERLLSASDVTQLLGVSRRTFESIVAKRQAPIFILVGRQRRWRPSDVENWIAGLAESAKSERETGSQVEAEAGR